MATKYIVDNVANQTISGNVTINGNLTVTGTSNNSETYRALLTQTGSLNGDSSYFNNRLIIGETYEITDYQNYDDFSNVANSLSGVVLTYTYSGTAVIGVINTYTSGGATSGGGSGIEFEIVVNKGDYLSVNIVTIGYGYVSGDTITILGTNVGGVSPDNDITITVDSATTDNPNETGSVFIATGDTPIIWGNSVLKSVGDLVVDVLENTLGDELVWFYEPEFQEGLYIAVFNDYLENNNLCKKFIQNKTQITAPPLTTPYDYDPYSSHPLNVVSNIDSLFFEEVGDALLLSVFDFSIPDYVGNSLYYIPIEIKINSNDTQEEESLITINWSTYSGDTDFNDYNIEFPPILNVSRMTTSDCGFATAHVHEEYESSDLRIQLYDNSIKDWVTVWEYTLNNPNYGFESSPDLYFPGNIDVTFTNITSVGGIRVTSDPESNQTYHDWGSLRFNFFN